MLSTLVARYFSQEEASPPVTESPSTQRLVSSLTFLPCKRTEWRTAAVTSKIVRELRYVFKILCGQVIIWNWQGRPIRQDLITIISTDCGYFRHSSYLVAWETAWVLSHQLNSCWRLHRPGSMLGSFQLLSKVSLGPTLTTRLWWQVAANNSTIFF